MMVGDSSMDGPGLEEHLEQQGLSIDKHEHGWIIALRPPLLILPPGQQRQINDEFWESFLHNPGREFMVKDKIKRLLEKITSYPWGEEQVYLVQFWAPEQQQQQQQRLYLTTYNQPFAVGCVHHERVIFGYRGRCMGHRYRVDDGADEWELGAVGRVYRNKRPESSPDLRLYSTNEFPFRDDADACGLRSYFALPLFDTEETHNIYGVIEILCLDGDDHMLTAIMHSLEAAQLRTTHLNLGESVVKDADSEIIEMLQLATRVMPQLQMAHVWIPCHECHNTNNISSCMELADPIVADGKVWDSIWNIGQDDMRRYYEACEFHHLQIGEDTNASASAVTSFGNKPRICLNLCDFGIYENPLVHYAQKARLSYCFAVRLQSSNNSRRDFKVVQFFLQCNSREDECFKSCFPLLLRIMEMKLKKYKFAYEGELGEELEVEVVSASSALRYETIKCKHHSSKELSSMLLETKRCNKIYPLSAFTKYLKKANLHYSQPSEEQCEHRWVFWSHASEEIRQNEPSLVSDLIQERIKCLMSKTANQQVLMYSAVGQFWAPKWDGDTCYLEAAEQPFFLHNLYKDLAYFRKQCMGHRYYVDGAAEDNKLGPPGRVFLNGHPEITPDLRLYSPTEFPLRDHAACCGLTSYLALPIFKLNEPQCVGVLELLGFYNFTLNYDVGKDLEEVNLNSTHINCKPGFPTRSLSGNNGEYWELASTEIRQACEQFATVPQLYMVEVWVPYNECPCNNKNTNFCMELIRTTERGVEWDSRSRQVQHVEIGKGIAGMALACESKSCFCRNSCEFSIADQPLAYDAWRPRLDVCFTICLQSHYTGDLVYMLHFYLNGTCREYTYFKIFLCSLLQKMKLAFKSFKVASGQELGEKLVVEVIEFSQENELHFSVSDQPEDLPVAFKFVDCHAQKYYVDKQVQSAEAVAQEETGQCSNVKPNLKRKDAAAEETKGTKKKTSSNLTFEMLKPYFGRKMKDVENIVGAHRSTIKRICRANGMKGWPWNENHKNNISIFMKESAHDNISNSPASHVTAPHIDSQSSRGPIVESRVDLVVIKAKYEDDTIRVQLCRSAGLEKLLNEVGRRLKLSVGSFKLKYVDEDNDEILLACDDDLQQCLKSPIAMDKPYVQVFVKLI